MRGDRWDMSEREMERRRRMRKKDLLLWLDAAVGMVLVLVWIAGIYFLAYALGG